ncbi:hypothetical protein [Jannaschia helgolandensis]|uniref:hypothetical protein n=1 Tax=Jannaschia helgolandensis TaxID=188906 RepID=UPI0030DC31FB
MQNLYAALAAAHPGFDVLDVKFMANLGEAADQKADELDSQFGTAVTNAENLELDQLV